MPAAVLAAVLATALSAGVLLLDLTSLSSTALIGLVWVAFAPFSAALSERPRACALALFAVAAPQVALGAAADQGAGASLAHLLPVALAALGWTAGLGAATAACAAVGRGERWLALWSALALAGPLFALALVIGGEGETPALLQLLRRASPLSALFDLAPLSAHNAQSPDTWSACILPGLTIAVAALWVTRAARTAASRAVADERVVRAEGNDGR